MAGITLVLALIVALLQFSAKHAEKHDVSPISQGNSAQSVSIFSQSQGAGTLRCTILSFTLLHFLSFSPD